VKKRETKADIRDKVSSEVPIEAIRDYVLARLKVRKGG